MTDLSEWFFDCFDLLLLLIYNLSCLPYTLYPNQTFHLQHIVQSISGILNVITQFSQTIFIIIITFNLNMYLKN